ncbi:MAG: hypothetical protein KDA62_02210 [Planctomycetales bacterium]|nr:hypothetical protein [Planctomycetales bacterium]
MKICLGCQLSLLIGVRAVPKVIECFAAAFDLRIKIPSRDAVRNWSCRNGVAILQEATRQADWVWMIDHSVQLGRMFVLVATMIEHQLMQTTSPDHARVVEKFGWILEFKTDLILWRQYRHLIGESLEMANEQGVFAGASEQLRERLSACDVASEPAREFGERIVSCYAHNEAQLKRLKRAGLRLPCSTEVLESAFGSFKALQGNHGRGTFTSLLSVFANQFDHCTAAKIRERFARVSNQDVKAWLRDSGLTNSTQSRRAKAYAQARPSETESTAS